MREVVIAGVGLHPWGKFPDKSWVQMGAETALEAVDDAGVQWTEIESMVCGAGALDQCYMARRSKPAPCDLSCHGIVCRRLPWQPDHCTES